MVFFRPMPDDQQEIFVPHDTDGKFSPYLSSVFLIPKGEDATPSVLSVSESRNGSSVLRHGPLHGFTQVCGSGACQLVKADENFGIMSLMKIDGTELTYGLRIPAPPPSRHWVFQKHSDGSNSSRQNLQLRCRVFLRRLCAPNNRESRDEHNDHLRHFQHYISSWKEPPPSTNHASTPASTRKNAPRSGVTSHGVTHPTNENTVSARS